MPITGVVTWSTWKPMAKSCHGGAAPGFAWHHAQCTGSGVCRCVIYGCITEHNFVCGEVCVIVWMHVPWMDAHLAASQSSLTRVYHPSEMAPFCQNRRGTEQSPLCLWDACCDKYRSGLQLKDLHPLLPKLLDVSANAHLHEACQNVHCDECRCKVSVTINFS